MLKDKTAYEMNRQRYIDAGRKDAEQRHKFRKAVHPNKKDKLH